MKIAICDDNISDLSNLVSLIEDYQALQSDKTSIKYTAFNSAIDLVYSMESGEQYDLVLLDILIPFLNGMDAAKEIRQFNKDVKIIFMTSSPEFAVDSYAVGAYYYALKPIWKEKLFILLDRVISENEIQFGASLLIKSKAGIIRIYINRLEYAEIIGRTILYHLTDGSVIEAIGSMKELEKILISNPVFIKSHRSYIINMEHIIEISQREVKMQSDSFLPLAKSNYSTVKSAYIKFAFDDN